MPFLLLIDPHRSNRISALGQRSPDAAGLRVHLCWLLWVKWCCCGLFEPPILTTTRFTCRSHVARTTKREDSHHTSSLWQHSKPDSQPVRRVPYFQRTESDDSILQVLLVWLTRDSVEPTPWVTAIAWKVVGEPRVANAEIWASHAVRPLQLLAKNLYDLLSLAQISPTA